MVYALLELPIKWASNPLNRCRYPSPTCSEVGEPRSIFVGLMLLHRGTLGTSSLVHLSVLAATRFLDKINLSGWVSFDRDVVAETSSTIARQIVDNLYENGVLAYSKREG